MTSRVSASRGSIPVNDRLPSIWTVFTNIGPIPGLPAASGSYEYYSNTTCNRNGGISPFAIFTSGPFKKKPINPYGCSAACSDALPDEPAAITCSVRAHS